MISSTSIRSARGFTLVELLVALVLLVLVSAAFWTALAGVQRSTRTQAELAAMHGTMRSGIQIIASDLQELYTDAVDATSDIESMSANAITYEAPRGSGLGCEATATAIKIRNDILWSGLHIPSNPPDAGLVIFADGDPSQSADDEWLNVAITGAVTPGTCGANPAWVVPVSITEAGDLARLAKVSSSGAPVRTYERVEVGLTTSDGRSWLGIRSVSGGQLALTPLAGPVAAANGVSFTYLRADGVTATASLNEVKQILVRLIGETDRSVNRGLSSTLETVIDTLTLRVELRNSR